MSPSHEPLYILVRCTATLCSDHSQVLSNYFSNALKFAPAGSEVTVRCSVVMRKPLIVAETAPTTASAATPLSLSLSRDGGEVSPAYTTAVAALAGGVSPTSPVTEAGDESGPASPSAVLPVAMVAIAVSPTGVASARASGPILQKGEMLPSVGSGSTAARTLGQGGRGWLPSWLPLRKAGGVAALPQRHSARGYGPLASPSPPSVLPDETASGGGGTPLLVSAGPQRSPPGTIATTSVRSVPVPPQPQFASPHLRLPMPPAAGGSFDLAPFLRVAVEDQGAGLTDAEAAQLFQPYAQIRAGAQQQGGGTGLGLALCKKIVELAGGSVGVSSEQRVCTVFWMEVPLEARPFATARPREQPPGGSASAGSGTATLNAASASTMIASGLPPPGESFGAGGAAWASRLAGFAPLLPKPTGDSQQLLFFSNSASPKNEQHAAQQAGVGPGAALSRIRATPAGGRHDGEEDDTTLLEPVPTPPTDLAPQGHAAHAVTSAPAFDAAESRAWTAPAFPKPRLSGHSIAAVVPKERSGIASGASGLAVGSRAVTAIALINTPAPSAALRASNGRGSTVAAEGSPGHHMPGGVAGDGAVVADTLPPASSQRVAAASSAAPRNLPLGRLRSGSALQTPGLPLSSDAKPIPRRPGLSGAPTDSFTVAGAPHRGLRSRAETSNSAQPQLPDVVGSDAHSDSPTAPVVTTCSLPEVADRGQPWGSVEFPWPVRSAGSGEPAALAIAVSASGGAPDHERAAAGVARPPLTPGHGEAASRRRAGSGIGLLGAAGSGHAAPSVPTVVSALPPIKAPRGAGSDDRTPASAARSPAVTPGTWSPESCPVSSPNATVAVGSSSVPLTGYVIRRAVVVDDVTTNRELFSRLLQRNGVSVVLKAEDGQDCLAQLEQMYLQHVLRWEAERSAEAEGVPVDTSALQSPAVLTTTTTTLPVTEPVASCSLPAASAAAPATIGSGAPVSVRPSFEAFLAAAVDCYFLDASMPRMDGPTLAGRLRALGLTTAIVGVTGNALDEDRLVFVRAGADAVVTKPCTSAKLISTLAGMGWSLPGPPGR